MATIAGFSVKYGFDYVKDTLIGHDSKELLENEWVTSEYGFPPINISTPKVLKRFELPVSDEVKDKTEMTTFMYGTLLDAFSVMVNTTKFPNSGENKINLEAISEGSIKGMEAQGAQNITVLRDEFMTPNGAEGLKTHGKLTVVDPITKKQQKAEYVLLHFTAENVLQQIVITYPDNDDYADQIIERILNSIELKKEQS